MPLKRGTSKATFKANLREMVRAGYPQNVAVAASSNAKRKRGAAKRHPQRSK